jgi:EmrB/QacA subfamily drug resistance transporter
MATCTNTAVSALLDRGRRTRAWPTFAISACGTFLPSLDVSIVNVAFPSLERSFPSVPTATLAWVITAYSIVFGALLVTAGRSADGYGRRRFFFLGLAVFSAGSILCGLAPTVWLLILGRVVQAAGAACLVPASLGLLVGAFPVQRRSQVVALWGGVGALAVATGPTLGAALVSAGGWRWAFYVNLPVAAVAWLWGRRVLAESVLPTARRTPDAIGIVLVSVSVGALVLGISEGPAWGWASPRILVSFAVVLLLGALFLWRSAHHPAPVLDLQLFRARSFSVANVATLLYAMGFFAMLLGNILFLTGVWHYSVLRAGLAVTPAPLVVAAVAGPAGRLAGRVGFRAVLVPGAMCFAAGLLWSATRVGLQPSFLVEWLPGNLVMGLGLGLAFPLLSAAAVSSLPPDKLAVGSAVNQTARQVGGAIGIAILVVLVGSHGAPTQEVDQFHHLWAYCAAMALGTGLAATWLRRPLGLREVYSEEE